MNRITIKPRGSMGVKVRERPPNSGKWWIFTDWKGKRSARFIHQGKRAAEEVAKRIAEKLNLIETNRHNGVKFSFRELVLGQPDPPSSVASVPTGPIFESYADSWLEELRRPRPQAHHLPSLQSHPGDAPEAGLREETSERDRSKRGA